MKGNEKLQLLAAADVAVSATAVRAENFVDVVVAAVATEVVDVAAAMPLPLPFFSAKCVLLTAQSPLFGIRFCGSEIQEGERKREDFGNRDFPKIYIPLFMILVSTLLSVVSRFDIIVSVAVDTLILRGMQCDPDACFCFIFIFLTFNHYGRTREKSK